LLPKGQLAFFREGAHMKTGVREAAQRGCEMGMAKIRLAAALLVTLAIVAANVAVVLTGGGAGLYAGL
jgi:hypothetical protein